jgi:UDP-glucuronate decarboxylase
VISQKFGRKRVLVTGGAGFLGSHLIDRLLDAGDEVLCVDNLFTGDKRNLDHLVGHSRFEFMRHDVCLPLYVEVDEIYNLACPASPVHYQYDPVQTTKTSVHGDPSVHPQPEEYWGNVNPIGIRSCYDEGKRCAETLFFDYHRQHNLEIKVVRIFNTYGPRMHPADGRVVSNFIVQALADEDITLYGDGSQSRSFCFYSDLIDGFIKMMASPTETVGPINIGNPVEFTIRELAELVIELTGSKSKLTYRPLPQDDPLQRKPIIEKAQAQLGWQPKVELREGLLKTIEYFRQISN